MIYLKIVLIAIILFIAAYLAGLSFSTREHRLKSENERDLSACPDKPNCVSSQSELQSNAIPAFLLVEDNPILSWKRLVVAIQQSGGDILINDGQYCHAVFTSSLFRFRDDFEAVLGETQIDIRSASRAGKSDMGKNRKRVEKIRRLYQ